MGPAGQGQRTDFERLMKNSLYSGRQSSTTAASSSSSPIRDEGRKQNIISSAKASRKSGGALLARISPPDMVPSAVVPPLRIANINGAAAASHNDSASSLRSENFRLQDDRVAGVGPADAAASHDARHITSDFFSSTIQELENLLNEAIHIARLASEEQQSGDVAHSSPNRNSDHGAKDIPLVRMKVKPRDLPNRNNKKKTKSETPAESVKPRGRVTFFKEEGSPEKGESASRSPAIRPSGAEGKIAVKGCTGRNTKPPQRTPGPHWKEQAVSAPPKYPRLSFENTEPSQPPSATIALREPQEHLSRRQTFNEDLPSRRTVRDYVKANDEPPIGPRTTSHRRSSKDVLETKKTKRTTLEDEALNLENAQATSQPGRAGDLDPHLYPKPGHERHFSTVFGVPSRDISREFLYASDYEEKINLKGCRHVDVPPTKDFDVHKSHHHQPVARDWPNSRKRFAASIASINTALLGIIIGIYSGEVPAIQYVIVDFHHYAILGNVFLYLGLAIPTLLLWPLPLLHGRKTYTVLGLSVALCLQIPQGIAVSAFRSPYVGTYRRLLLLSRAVSGFAFGFANVNHLGTMLDLFGASLQSRNPHQEVVDEFDVRRHGGGMGLWLGIWCWCTTGSISIGFFVGAVIIGAVNASWGFWTSLLLLMVVLLLNIISPEVRRSAFRRTVAEVKGEGGEFSRVGRGEVKMHVKAAGPYWWGEEIKAGMELSFDMIKQPGFAILALYTAWVYAQFTMMLMLLGALASRYYHLQPAQVGACVLSLGSGAFLAMPFQKGSFFSRARRHGPRTDSMSFERRVICSSHLARRITFTVALPVAAIAYTLTAQGPPMPLYVPVIFTGLVGFLSDLAMAECYGLVMETFDTSDLQPGMTGRPRASIWGTKQEQRTNFSCYPRVSAGFGIIQSLKFILAAAGTGVCGRLERRLGVIKATSMVAAVLMTLTALLTVVLFRFRRVRMIPDEREVEARLTQRRGTEWRPVILGKPSGSSRKISMLEGGAKTRWSEIRARNQVDSWLT